MPSRIRDCSLQPTQEEIDDVRRQLTAIASNPHTTIRSEHFYYDDQNTMRLWEIMRKGIDSHSTASPYRCWNCKTDFNLFLNKTLSYVSRVSLEIKGWLRTSDKNWKLTPESYDFRFARDRKPRLADIRPFPDNPSPFPHPNMLHCIPVPPVHRSHLMYNGQEEFIFTSGSVGDFDRRHIYRK